jgi:NhaP-type Na+/H+ or K+/H+ antiporter
LDSSYWYLAAGLLFVFMAIARTAISKLPLSSALVYLAIGVLLGPQVLGAIDVTFPAHAKWVEVATEIVIISALFTGGLRLRKQLSHGSWFTALRLATLGMLVSVALLAFAAHFGLGLSLAESILLAGILSPTDPVLAADVQVKNHADRDHVRFSLTAEAGLNDGTAFPFVMLGLALMLHGEGTATASSLVPLLLRWTLEDLLWATVAGVAAGYGIGRIAARVVLYFRTLQKENDAFDEFLALGVIALTYALCHFIGAYGFLGVFAAGVAFRHIEMAGKGEAASEMTTTMLESNEQLQRLGEVLVVVLVGALLTPAAFGFKVLAFACFVFLVCRPCAVFLSFPQGTHLQKRLMAWFGVRGIGSVYYFAYAAALLSASGTGMTLSRTTIDALLACIALSALVHGISVTPIMGFYERTMKRRARNIV